ncbi:MAG: hypothetical protein LN414_04490, partial [Candidatus Thermoplasmatota archaeon]|nr:hypothetical protein [Candidatus Thermoplasmatota archaeon]
MLACAVLIVITVSALILTTDDATAWTTEDVNFTNDDDESGRILDSNGVFYKQRLTNTTGYASMGIVSSYWGYMSVPIAQFDDRTYIQSATVYFYAYGLTSP